MLQEIYAIRDVKVGFGQPFLADNDPIAMRNFTVSVRQADSLLHWCPLDYSLWSLGCLDTSTGIITCDTPPVCIMQAADVDLNFEK